MSKIFITIDETHGQLQLSIGDDNGGYRIFGPKFDGSNKTLKRHCLSERDVAEIKQYLTRVRAHD